MGRPVHVSIKLRKGDSSEKIIRKFFKKCKKKTFLEDHIEKTSFYKTKSEKRRDKILKNKRLRELEALKLARRKQRNKKNNPRRPKNT